MLWYGGYPLDWDESAIGEEDSTKKEKKECATDFQHRYKEVVCFNMTHWECERCGSQINFDQIQKHQTIASRCSMFKLPYDE